MGLEVCSDKPRTNWVHSGYLSTSQIFWRVLSFCVLLLQESETPESVWSGVRQQSVWSRKNSKGCGSISQGTQTCNYEKSWGVASVWSLPLALFFLHVLTAFSLGGVHNSLFNKPLSHGNVTDNSFSSFRTNLVTDTSVGSTLQFASDIKTSHWYFTTIQRALLGQLTFPEA